MSRQPCTEHLKLVKITDKLLILVLLRCEDSIEVDPLSLYLNELVESFADLL